MGPKTLCNLQCEYTKDLATLWCNNSSKHNGLKLFLKLHSHFRAFFTRFLYTFHTRGIFMLPLRKCCAGSFELFCNFDFTIVHIRDQNVCPVMPVYIPYSRKRASVFWLQLICYEWIFYCTGILIRADLAVHAHSTLFGRNWLIGWIGLALLGQPSKRHLGPCRILILFPYCSLHYKCVPHIKKLETFFALFIFLDFRTVCMGMLLHKQATQDKNFGTECFKNIVWKHRCMKTRMLLQEGLHSIVN